MIKAEIAAGNPAPMRATQAPLNYRSVAVIYGFCNWPESRPDQMEAVDALALLKEDKTTLLTNNGLQEWLEEDYPDVLKTKSKKLLNKQKHDKAMTIVKP